MRFLEEDRPVKLGFKIKALGAVLSVGLNFAAVVSAQQQSSVPDAPAPQNPAPLGSVGGPITPGIGAGSEPTADGGSPNSSSTQQPTPGTQPTRAPEPIQATPPETASPAELANIFRINVTYVEVPVTVKDSKGNLVPGLTWRDFRVFENGTYEPLKVFSVDPMPLSIAFVIDQGLTSDVMDRVNESMGAIQGALTPYDELAIFTYSHISHEWTGFTGAQSARVPAVFAIAKASGTEELIPVNSGPLAGCSVHVNGNCADPNLQEGRSTGSGSGVITIPKEIHTLNDAILAAAKELSTRPKGPPHYLRDLRWERSRQQGNLQGRAALSADEQYRCMGNTGGRLGALGRGLPEPLPHTFPDERQSARQVHLHHRWPARLREESEWH
jgi:hypothetical protein